jgi:hypothetical protein
VRGFCNDAVSVYTIWRRMVGCVMSDGFEGIWKEAVGSCRDLIKRAQYPDIFLEGLKKTAKSPRQDSPCSSRDSNRLSF